LAPNSTLAINGPGTIDGNVVANNLFGTYFYIANNPALDTVLFRGFAADESLFTPEPSTYLLLGSLLLSLYFLKRKSIRV
jgi:hypothetical protein